MLHQASDDLSDRQLLSACAGRDREACGAFVARHRDAVWRYVRILVDDPVAAEDVLQDTFLAALRHAGGFSGDAARPWILTIARNAAHRRFRRRVGEPTRFEPLLSLGEEAGFGADDAEIAIARAEDQAALQRALASLSPEDQEVLVLRELEGLDGVATAALLGLPLPTMKTRLHRARLRLAAALRIGGSDGT